MAGMNPGMNPFLSNLSMHQVVNLPTFNSMDIKEPSPFQPAPHQQQVPPPPPPQIVFPPQAPAVPPSPPKPQPMVSMVCPFVCKEILFSLSYHYRSNFTNQENFQK